MALTASCPSCGAPVVFQSAASVFAVCEFCQSTLVRHDTALEDIGKMAALAEDRSLLQLGSEGVWEGVHFALIGRIQLQYSQGLWNEWHLLFDDQRTGWLSEAGGQYVISFIEHPQEPLPALDDLKVGERRVIAARTWTVSDIEQATCIAGQGELPFKVGAGYPVATVDLRNGKDFATVDYSETPPLLFVGKSVTLNMLQLANLRDGASLPEITVHAEVFRCPACGAAQTVRSGEILSVGCTSCGAAIDTGNRQYKLLSRATDQGLIPYQRRLALGSHGTFDGHAVEVIGFLVRSNKSEGITYRWGEYLLAGADEVNRGTYRWLTEYNGHWNIVDVLDAPPERANRWDAETLRLDGETYRHFALTNTAEVIHVEGEFTWRVRHGDTCQINEYVAPPLALARESTANEVTWSRGRYLTPADIRTAFKLTAELPEPIGVYSNQPNPWTDTHRRTCRLFWPALLLAMALQALFIFGHGSQLLLRQDFNFNPAQPQETGKSREFQFPGGKLALRNATSLDNHWIGLDFVLVNKTTGDAWPASRELAFYSGYDSDGSWSEGNREDEVVFTDLPAGTYYLTVDPDFSPEKRVAVSDRIEIYRPGAAWSNFILLLLALAAFPIFSRMRVAAFETRRWLESDHPPVTTSANGDDD